MKNDKRFIDSRGKIYPQKLWREMEAPEDCLPDSDLDGIASDFSLWAMGSNSKDKKLSILAFLLCVFK